MEIQLLAHASLEGDLYYSKTTVSLRSGNNIYFLNRRTHAIRSRHNLQVSTDACIQEVHAEYRTYN